MMHHNQQRLKIKQNVLMVQDQNLHLVEQVIMQTIVTKVIERIRQIVVIVIVVVIIIIIITTTKMKEKIIKKNNIIKTTAIMQIIFLILIMKMMKKITEHQLNKLYHLDLMFIIFNIQIHQV